MAHLIYKSETVSDSMMRSIFKSLLCLPFLVLFLTASISQTNGPQSGTCILVGGGLLDEEIYQALADGMGGFDEKLIIIPTAAGDELISRDTGFVNLRNRFRKQGFTFIDVVHTSDSSVANQDSFASRFKGAKGVWFTGGRQWRLVDAYANTKTLRAIKNLLDHGGVVAGTSAGATIQGSFLARGDTKTNTIMMGDHQEGFGFISNVAIDQHVLRRNRQFDMLEICEAYPNLLGIGLDENTALMIRANTAEVIGKSYVLIYDDTVYDDETDSYLPNPGGFHFLHKGQKYHLKDRRRIK